jgi:hypothetical protein
MSLSWCTVLPIRKPARVFQLRRHMATLKRDACAHVLRRATRVRRRPAAGQVHEQRCPLVLCTGAGPKPSTTSRRTESGRIGIRTSTTRRCAAVVGAFGRGRIGSGSRVKAAACPCDADEDGPSCFETACTITMAVTAPISSRQQTVRAARPNHPRFLMACVEASGRGCGVGAGAAGAVTGSGSSVRARLASSGSTRTSSGLIGSRPARAVCDDPWRREASSALEGGADARNEESGMRAGRPGRFRRGGGSVLPPRPGIPAEVPKLPAMGTV